MTNVHVFTWTGANVRHPLADGTERWMEYLSHIRKDGKERDLILEFVQDDRDDALFEDAKNAAQLAEPAGQTGRSDLI